MRGLGEHVVLVEPDECAARSYEDVLTDAGLSVVTIDNAEGALRICAELCATVDLVITRAALTNINGMELARQIEHLHRIPVLLISQFSRQLLSQARGFSHHLDILEEPFSLRELVLNAREALCREI